jgi:hypothetical protein
MVLIGVSGRDSMLNRCHEDQFGAERRGPCDPQSLRLKFFCGEDRVGRTAVLEVDSILRVSSQSGEDKIVLGLSRG